MKLFADHDPRFRLLTLKVVLFIAAACVGLLVLVGGLGMASGIFTKKTPFYFIAGNALDIRPGMAVMLSGFKIGSVDDLKLRDDAKVHVDIRIEDRYIEWMREGTAVEVKKQGLIGEAYIDVRPGASANLLSQDGKGQVAYKTAKGLEEIASDIESKVVPVIQDAHAVVQDLHRLAAYLNDEKGSFKRSMGHIEQVAGHGHESLLKAERTLTGVDGLVADVRRTVEADVRPMVVQARETLAATEGAAASAQTQIDKIDLIRLQQDIGLTLERMNKSLGDVNHMTGALKEPVARSAPQLPGFIDDTQSLVREGQTTLRQANTTLHDMERILDGARQQWPFNLWAPHSATILIPESGHD